MAKRRVVPKRSGKPGPRPTKRESRVSRRRGPIRGDRPYDEGIAVARAAEDTVSTVHPSAVVDPGATVGAGTRIWHWSHVMTGAHIGRGCSLGQNVFVGTDVVIGDRVKIQNNVSLYEGVAIEDDVFCGPSMVFTNVINPRSHISRTHEFRPTMVRRGATIGANATVICGHTIGQYAFVGAGAVVTRDVPDHALVVGVPARVVGWMCCCGLRLTFRAMRAECGGCGGRYARRGRRVVPLA